MLPERGEHCRTLFLRCGAWLALLALIALNAPLLPRRALLVAALAVLWLLSLAGVVCRVADDAIRCSFVNLGRY